MSVATRSKRQPVGPRPVRAAAPEDENLDMIAIVDALATLAADLWLERKLDAFAPENHSDAETE